MKTYILKANCKNHCKQLNTNLAKIFLNNLRWLQLDNLMNNTNFKLLQLHLLKFLKSLISILIIAPSTLVWAKNYTLDQIIQLGLSQNPTITATQQGIAASREATKAAKRAMGPSLSTEFGFLQKNKAPSLNGMPIGDEHLWSGKLNLHQPIFTGGYLFTNYELNQLKEQQAKEQLKQLKIELKFNLKKTFYEILKAKAIVTTYQKNIARLQEHLKVIQNFYQQGLKPQVEVLQAKTALANAKTNLITAKNLVQTQKSFLKTLLNLPQNSTLNCEGQLEYKPFFLSLTECQKIALKNRPELAIAKKNIELAKKTETIVKSSFYPQIAADATYYKYGEDPDLQGTPYLPSDSWQVAIGLRWNIFESGSTLAKLQQAKYNLARVKAVYQDLKNRIAYEVKSAYLSLNSAKQAILAARQTLIEARETFKLATARYKSQLGTNIDVLDATTKLSQAESTYVGSLANYAIALSNLERSMGR
ncbi:MAG: TolC family protein [Desulfonauticus sp.]|nr:TolC family protein [Desulfonauticus sp.]